ncbi:MAG: hypothetical protein M1818_000703 [Claussenomyces sp. TS43310]|nr:MAG: hypothetical protein M1818_000703 [Claussenomyces sp. TS43310]
MAMSPSPQLSPSVGAAHRVDRMHADTPTQPLSKRDKKRNQLFDRFEEITQHFSANKDAFYRSQLQALQIDINLILQSEAYGEEPPTDFGDDIAQLVQKYTGGNPQAMLAVAQGDALAFAGRIYSEFAADVGTASEERDANMVRHTNEYEKKIADLQNSNAFMIKLAEEEHKALSSTLRDRLINSVTGRKARLQKEKENLEIGDSNALLMHPNQFSMNNPASPGGIHGKRATRHRRDIEDLPSFADSHKRKRKAADDAESPAPSRRLLDNGFNTPIWTPGELGKATDRSGSPLYSIDKLFTEKELSMIYNTSAIAAHQYVVSHRAQVNGGGSSQHGSSQSNPGDNEHDVDHEDGANAPNSPPMMERQISHATRSTRGGLGLGNFSTGIGIDVIGDLSQPGNFARVSAQLPKMPPPISSVMHKAYNKETANSPMGVSIDEAIRDMHHIDQSKELNAQAGLGTSLDADDVKDRLLLGAAVSQPGTYATFIRSDDGGGKGKGTARQLLFEETYGGVAMSKQSSMGGSEGGVSMSRAGTQEGGRRRRA